MSDATNRKPKGGIECHFTKCQHHDSHNAAGQHDRCFKPSCLATQDQMRLWRLEQRLIAKGYDLEELDRDSPYYIRLEGD